MYEDVLALDVLGLILAFFFAFDLELAIVRELLHHTSEIRFLIFFRLLTLGFFFNILEIFFFQRIGLVIVFEEVYDFILQCLF